jgi:pimeloyl-ACP methyl ester carboxylesterase
MGVVAKTAIVIAVIWISAIVFCWWLQKKMLFYPNTVMSDYLPDGYQPFHLDESGKDVKDPGDKTISGWYIPKKRKTILFCHGNTGNISHRDYLVDLCDLFGLSVILFDYSGYGLSGGEPSVGTMLKDGERVYRYARTLVDPGDLIIWGESLGGSVATDLASRFPCSALVLLATFSSLDDILIYSQRPYSSVLSLGLRIASNTLRSKDKVARVRCPVAIVHSMDDRLIPFQCAQALYERVPTKKLLIPIHGGHATPMVTVAQILQLMSFLGITERPESFLIQRALTNIRTAAQRHQLV